MRASWPGTPGRRAGGADGRQRTDFSFRMTGMLLRSGANSMTCLKRGEMKKTRGEERTGKRERRGGAPPHHSANPTDPLDSWRSSTLSWDLSASPSSPFMYPILTLHTPTSAQDLISSMTSPSFFFFSVFSKKNLTLWEEGKRFVREREKKQKAGPPEQAT